MVTIFGVVTLSAAMLGCDAEPDAVDQAPDINTQEPDVEIDVNKGTAATDRDLEGQGHTTMRPPDIDSGTPSTETPTAQTPPRGVTGDDVELPEVKITPPDQPGEGADASGEETTVPEIDISPPETTQDADQSDGAND
jgi:hypothetical protein